MDAFDKSNKKSEKAITTTGFALMSDELQALKGLSKISGLGISIIVRFFCKTGIERVNDLEQFKRDCLGLEVARLMDKNIKENSDSSWKKLGITEKSIRKAKKK